MPRITPICRFCSSVITLSASEEKPASASASVEAAKAMGTQRETCLRSWASIQASSSNCFTSPAICTGRSSAGKRVMRPTPLRPSRMARQKAALPLPLGLRQPMPVMTTRRDINRFYMDAQPKRGLQREKQHN